MRAQAQANPENSTLLLERTEKVLFTTQLPLLTAVVAHESGGDGILHLCRPKFNMKKKKKKKQ